MINLIKESDFIRIVNDINGNPRYVCHYLFFGDKYEQACKLANKAGGRKYRAKWYGGGIVFKSYNLQELCDFINKTI